MPRRLVPLVLGVTLAAGLSVVAAPAEALGTVAVLGLTTFSDLVVDDAHQQVFVSGGPTGSTVEVRGFDGSFKATVSGQTGASGLAVAPDGSAVYAALDGAGAVSRISTTTLAETTRYAIGRSTCVSSLAFAGTRLFVGYGCAPSREVAELDLAAATPALGTALTGAWDGPVHLAGDAAGRRLVAVDETPSQGTVRSYDLAQSPPTATAVSTSTVPGAGCDDVAVEPTAGDAVLACEAPVLANVALASSDLSPSFSYATPLFPIAVAVTDGAVAGATSGFSGIDIVLSDRHTAPAAGAIYMAAGRVAPRGLAFSAGAGTLFAVTTPLAANLRLSVYPHPFATASTLTLGGPATAARASALTLTGTLTGATTIPAGASLAVTKKDLAGSHALAPVTTDAAGAFTVTDTPQVGGTNTYTVAYAGGARHEPATASAVVAVSRVTPLLRVTPNASVYAYNGVATVTVHLGPTFTNRAVKVYAQQILGPKVLVRSGTVDAAGNLVVTRRVPLKTTVTAVFDGDFRTAPSSVSRTVTAAVLVGETVRRHYATSGGYYLYRTTADPTLDVKVTPGKVGQCVRFVVQRYSAGAWRAWSTVTCAAQLSIPSTATVSLAGRHPRGDRFRMRVEFPRDQFGWNAPGAGAWKYFRFP